MVRRYDRSGDPFLRWKAAAPRSQRRASCQAEKIDGGAGTSRKGRRPARGRSDGPRRMATFSAGGVVLTGHSHRRNSSQVFYNSGMAFLYFQLKQDTQARYRKLLNRAAKMGRSRRNRRFFRLSELFNLLHAHPRARTASHPNHRLTSRSTRSKDRLHLRRSQLWYLRLSPCERRYYQSLANHLSLPNIVANFAFQFIDFIDESALHYSVKVANHPL